MSANLFSGAVGDPLRGPRIKIDRANSHIDDIEREIDAALNGEAYSLFIEPNLETGDRLAKIKFVGEIPDSLFLLVPETIYHLRSTLDQLMVRIARTNGLESVGHIYFPFGETIEEIHRAARKEGGRKGKLFGLPEDVQDIVIAMEPHKGGQQDLWALSRLSNVDKHGDLIPIGTVSHGTFMRNISVRNCNVGIMFSGTRSLTDGITISDLGQEGTILTKDGRHPTCGPQGSKADIEITASIAFGSVDVFDGQPVVPTLRQLSSLTESIVQIFASYCFDP